MYRTLTFAALLTIAGCRTPALLPPAVNLQKAPASSTLKNTVPDTAQSQSDQNSANHIANGSQGLTALPGLAGDFEVIPPPTTPREDWDKWMEHGAPLPVGADDKSAMVVYMDPDRRWTPIYFAYNQTVIGETERRKLELFGRYLLENTRYQLLIEGHCDERGSNAYNRALGENRAIIVRDYLVALGVNRDRIQTLSYGEDKPADTGTGEGAHANNRRAEFIVLSPQN